MIDIRVTKGMPDRFELNGNIFDLVADITSVIAATYAAIHDSDPEGAEEFTRIVKGSFSNDGFMKYVFENNPYVREKGETDEGQ